MDRAEHLQWCKDRAMEYVEAGDFQSAFGSMASDLGKHPETAGHPGIQLGMMELMLGTPTRESMTRHIEGYN